MTDSAIEGFLTRVTEWASGEEDVRAVLLMGSHARTVRPSDEWSDLDIVLVADHPERILADTDWLERLAPVLLTFLEHSFLPGVVERRVLFDSGLAVDIVPFPAAVARAMARADLPDGIANALGRGVRVLADKEGFRDLLANLPPVPSYVPPTALEFSERVADFWFHTLWTAKQLWRGELWAARMCCDGRCRELLLTMVGWHHRAVYGETCDVWFDGRFLEQWSDAHTRSALDATIGGPDSASVWRALHAMGQLYRSLGSETAERLGYDYPRAVDADVCRLVGDRRSPAARRQERALP